MNARQGVKNRTTRERYGCVERRHADRWCEGAEADD